MYLFVQCSEFRAAARLIGATDAFVSYIGRKRQPSEERLLVNVSAQAHADSADLDLDDADG